MLNISNRTLERKAHENAFTIISIVMRHLGKEPGCSPLDLIREQRTVWNGNCQVLF